MLVGVATVPPNEDCLEYQVTLFTRLDKYIGWIRDHVEAKAWPIHKSPEQQ
jgi:hypothetical protein